MINIKITLTITSCRRFNLLEKTITSFFDNCLDINCIDKIILIDDNSDSPDLAKISSLLEKTNKPYILIHKNEFLKGHVASLNILYDTVKSTDYVIHLEDDFECIKKDNFIEKAFNIMQEDQSIKQFLFRVNAEIMAVDQIKLKSKSGIEYIKYNYIGQHAKDMHNRPAWSGWNLNPALWNYATIRELGKFNHEKAGFEYDYSRKFWKCGYKVAYFTENYFEHIGVNNSAYRLNNTKR